LNSNFADFLQVATIENFVQINFSKEAEELRARTKSTKKASEEFKIA
jgi:hypothetical protein